MNIRDFIWPFLLTGALMFFFRDWFGPHEGSRTEFIAPASQAELEPLYTALVSGKEHGTVEEKKERIIKTSYGEFTFSSYGASLEKAVLYQGKDKRAFSVIDQSLTDTPDYAPFVVALDNSTPWNYVMHPVQEDENSYRLVCNATTQEAGIQKIYTIDKNKNRIDLTLTITPHNKMQTRVRVIWHTPVLNGSEESMASQQVFRIDTAGTFKKYPLKKLNEQMGFFTPTFFGVESKYFVLSFFQDSNQPAQRAYYKIHNGFVYAFIESKMVSQKTELKYSFALIPKDMEVLYPDIAPLEKTYDYGFFAFFTKFMLYLLHFVNQFIHNYGWSIIILTCLLKLVLLPLTYNSAEKLKIVKENERKFNYMQQKLQNDPEALQRLREEHVKENLSSLLTTQGPLFLQMPFIFGLSGVINNSLELCGAPFIGWMHDISMPDKYYILPIIFGILFFLNLVTGKSMNIRKFVGFLALTLFITGLFTNFSVAFLLFILVNMMFRVGETLVVERVRR